MRSIYTVVLNIVVYLYRITVIRTNIKLTFKDMSAIETGLMLFPRTSIDLKYIYDVIQDSEFSADYNSEYGCFIFPEEEENYDELESELDELLSGRNVNYRIEGIF